MSTKSPGRRASASRGLTPFAYCSWSILTRPFDYRSLSFRPRMRPGAPLSTDMPARSSTRWSSVASPFHQRRQTKGGPDLRWPIRRLLISNGDDLDHWGGASSLRRKDRKSAPGAAISSFEMSGLVAVIISRAAELLGYRKGRIRGARSIPLS